MYLVDVAVVGIAPLLQNRFKLPEIATMSKGGQKVTGSVDYTEEWRDKLYANGDGVYQPATHFERAMTKAAAGFRITGKRGKSYKELFEAAVFVHPDQIPHGIETPDNLDTDADKPLYLHMEPVVVNRGRVVRIRPAFKAGWRLEFEIECIDDQVNASLLQDVLTVAGKTCGIGDHRPRFGRFDVVRFEVQK